MQLHTKKSFLLSKTIDYGLVQVFIAGTESFMFLTTTLSTLRDVALIKMVENIFA